MARIAGEDGRPGALLMDRHEVTNREFSAFVAATGYVTTAERLGNGAVFSPPSDLGAGGLDNTANWWRLVDGANWRQPDGPGSDISGRDDYPVVQVTHEDAVAYARWRGGRLPTEAEWEHAARAGRTGKLSRQQWAYDDDGKATANTWQGLFPVLNTGEDGYPALAPVGCFAANGYGLYDMIGNVWELTASDSGDGKSVIKGGSFLCSFNYCMNFYPAAREAQEHDLSTSHIGFRIVMEE